MEQNNPNLPPSSFCRAGCGFYGNDSFEGHCSKCYKDVIKRKQSSSPVGSAGRASPSMSGMSGISPGDREVMNSMSQTLARTNLGSTMEAGSTSSSSSSLSSPSTTPSVETATPTISVPSVDKDKEKEDEATGGAEVKDCSGTSPADGAKDKKKKNRCHSCKKKVGLTGFLCRCGGLFCSLHRYSDKHECTFNYKEMAQEQIRKNNPVIVGEKVQKI